MIQPTSSSLKKEEDPDGAFLAQPTSADVGEDEWIEQLTAEGDEDASLITEFEEAAAEALQEDPSLATAYSAYQDARKRLAEKARFRGFWPTTASRDNPLVEREKGSNPSRVPEKVKVVSRAFPILAALGRVCKTASCHQHVEYAIAVAIGKRSAHFASRTRPMHPKPRHRMQLRPQPWLRT